jgi:hypothetical protein
MAFPSPPVYILRPLLLPGRREGSMASPHLTEVHWGTSAIGTRGGQQGSEREFRAAPGQQRARIDSCVVVVVGAAVGIIPARARTCTSCSVRSGMVGGEGRQAGAKQRRFKGKSCLWIAVLWTSHQDKSRVFVWSLELRGNREKQIRAMSLLVKQRGPPRHARRHQAATVKASNHLHWKGGVRRLTHVQYHLRNRT